MELTVIYGSIELGLLFGIMAIGVYLTFRILDYPDLTVDGSYATGGAVAATSIANGVDPWLSTLFALIAGGLAGAVTGLLHTKGKINGLLAGILTMIALYSINLRIMGKANVPLLKEDTVITAVTDNGIVKGMDWMESPLLITFLLLIVLLIKFTIDWFLRTDLGMAIRATGDNPKMISSLGVNTDNSILIGLILSNALVGLAGGLMAQYQGFADVQMGVGMIVIGLASVIIGEVLFGKASIARATFAIIGGALIYRFVIAAALELNLEPTDIKLITALIVIAALTAPRFKIKKQKKNTRNLEEGVTNVTD
jgi:putative ABC transport system permease protein